jgi:hypothetical protein
VPGVRRRYPADRVQTAFRVRNHPWRTLGNLRLLRTSCPRTRGRSGRSSRIWANRSSLRQSLLPVARPPTGESSSRSTFDRAIFQASPFELPVIDVHSL